MRRLAIILLTLVAMLLVAPAQAIAAGGSYSIDELSTELTVETNGAVHIVERQTLAFDDVNEGVTWYLHSPESGESVRIANVRVAPVDDGGSLLAEWTRLQMIDSDPFHQGRNPGDSAASSLREIGVQPWYSFNIGDGMIRCYFPTGRIANERPSKKEIALNDGSAEAESADTEGIEGAENAERALSEAGEPQAETPSDTEADDATESSADEPTDEFHTYVIETDYTVAHRVYVYRDVAELFWRYAHDSLPADANDVTFQIRLPLPADADPAAAIGQVRAWGHGPDEGSFTIGEDGTVTYRITRVQQGNYAEAHIVFPSDWMTNMSPNAANQFSEQRGAIAVDEETEWVDTALRESAWENAVRALFLGLAVLVILAGAIGVFRHGRSPQSRRSLVRAAAALGILAAGENVVFREPMTTIMLAALAVIVAAIAFVLPATEEEAAADAQDEGGL